MEDTMSYKCFEALVSIGSRRLNLAYIPNMVLREEVLVISSPKSTMAK
jgi:hypothetical protein